MAHADSAQRIIAHLGFFPRDCETCPYLEACSALERGEPVGCELTDPEAGVDPARVPGQDPWLHETHAALRPAPPDPFSGPGCEPDGHAWNRDDMTDFVRPRKRTEAA